MKILKADLREDGIHVEAELEGGLFKRKFHKDKDAKDIRKEFSATEENMKQEKIKKEEYKIKEKENEKANKTIDSLIS